MKVYLKISKKVKKFTSLLYSGEHALTIFFSKKHLLSFSSAENSEVFLSHRISHNISIDNKDDVPAASHLGLKQKYPSNSKDIQ